LGKCNVGKEVIRKADFEFELELDRFPLKTLSREEEKGCGLDNTERIEINLHLRNNFGKTIFESTNFEFDVIIRPETGRGGGVSDHSR